MEKVRRNDANSLKSALRSTITLSNLSGRAVAGSSVNDNPNTSATLPTESNGRNAPKKSSRREIASTLTNAFDPSMKNGNHHSDLQKLKHEMETLKSQARSIEKQNEILRWLLTPEQAEHERTFRRAILMRIYPEEVINAIGVQEGHESTFVALEATLFTSKSLPIQKVSTSFSDGHWQEEMKFILDTENRWMEGRFVLELKTKNVASDDTVIATASISAQHFLDWLQEGGEHSVQIEMDRTFPALHDEIALTMLFFTVKVATERISLLRTLNIEAPLKSSIAQLIDDKSSVSAIEPHNQNAFEVLDKVLELPGIPIEDVEGQNAAPCLTNSLQPDILGAVHIKTDFATFALSSTDDEDENHANTSNTLSAKGVRRFDSVPTSNRSCSADSAARLSLLSMLFFQRKNEGPKPNLKPVQEGSKEGEQIKMLNPSLLDYELVSNHAVTLVSKTHLNLVTRLGNSSENHFVDESTNLETDKDPNFVETIKSVSFAYQRDFKSDVAADSSKNDSSVPVEQLKATSGIPDHATIEIDQHPARRCFDQVGSSLKVWFATAQIIVARVFGQCHRRKRLASVRPVREVLDDAETCIEALNLSEQRRHAIFNGKLKAKQFLEEFETDKDTEFPAEIGSENDSHDPVGAKLIFAISQLQNAFFNLPQRAKKITPISLIEQCMKTLPAGNSTAHQRLDAIQHFLQSKWIECDSMLKIMIWIRSPTDEVTFFESMAMRVTDKHGLMMIARRFIYAHGTKFVALKTVERLLVLSKKDTQARNHRRASHFRVDDFDEQGLPAHAGEQEFSVDESGNL